MAEPRLKPDPFWLAEFERLAPGDPDNESAALGIAYVQSLWPGGEQEARAHLERVFADLILEVMQGKLERACSDPNKTPAEVRAIARELDQLRRVRVAA